MQEGCFSKGAFKDKQFREDFFSGMLAMISHAGRMCLGEVLATKSHAEGIDYRKCFQGYVMREGCAYRKRFQGYAMQEGCA